MPKTGRNEKCPCGSGMKYKKCCINKSNEIPEDNVNFYIEKYQNICLQSKVKECLHPDKVHCNNIINAHSIQNNKILKMISDNGHVLMPKKKNKLILISMEKWGRSNATTFTGFCKKHDMETFRDIENNVFDKSNKHIFLYVYRNWAYSFHSKKEQRNILAKICTENDIKFDSKRADELRNNEVAVSDLHYYKKFFDECLTSDSYEIFESIVWEFQFPIKFSASGVFVPEYDFSGIKIQEIHDLQCLVKHIFVEVFPEGEKSYCILSWLKEDDKIFNSYRASLKEFKEKQIKNYMNNLIQIHMDNIVINPSAFEKQSKHAKDEFLALVWGVHMLSGVHPSEEACRMLDETTLDLFSL